jgi:Cu+-exporting ATPase
VWPVVTAVLIVACPCALALAMPFAYGHTIRLLGTRGLFLRDAEVVERMAFIDAVVFDKTGTLTAREAYDLAFTGVPLTPQERMFVRSLARNSTHPLSAVLYNGLKAPLQDAVLVEEVAGEGIGGMVAGITIRLGSPSFTDGPVLPREPGQAQVHVSVGGVYRGRFDVRKRARSGMADSVNGIGSHARTYLLTGDATVDAEVADVFDASRMRTGCTPPEKARFVRDLQAEGRRVMMVGDGLNDAGALQQSDIGVTVSESSAALSPASDAILDARGLPELPAMMHLARRARRIVFASLGISLMYNVTGVSFAVSGHLTPLVAAILMPLSSVTVVGFVSIAIWLAARQLGLRSGT